VAHLAGATEATARQVMMRAGRLQLPGLA
jgi:hypothetical protein